MRGLLVGTGSLIDAARPATISSKADWKTEELHEGIVSPKSPDSFTSNAVLPLDFGKLAERAARPETAESSSFAFAGMCEKYKENVKQNLKLFRML